MLFERVKATNFKSLKSVDLELQPVNILIGKNASGKTNLLELFKFAFLCVGPTTAIPYPFAPWWGYNNIVWSGKEDLPVGFEFSVRFDGVAVTYSGTVTGYAGRLNFQEERVAIGGMLEFSRFGAEATLSYEKDFVESRVRKLSKDVLQHRFFPGADKRDLLEIIQQPQKIDVEPSRSILGSRGGSWSSTTGTDLAVGQINQVVRGGETKAGFVFVSPIVGGDSSRPHFPNVIFPFLLGESFGAQKMILIRHLNPTLIRQPEQVAAPAVLGEHGEGLTSIMFNWFTQNQKLPDRIDYVLRELFPNWALSFTVTQDGRVMMTVKENGFELQPPSIPDGLYKLLAILVALELKPSVLLIDEFENSLHARLIEYLLEILRTSNTTVILSSHSATVVDLAKLEELVVVEKSGSESRFTKVADPEAVRERLKREGVTTSESWLYGKLP